MRCSLAAPRRVAACILAIPSLAVARASAQERVLTVIARDHSFELPQSVPAGMTSIRLLNKSSSHHQIVVQRLPEGVSFEDFRRAAAKGTTLKMGLTSFGGPETPRDTGSAALAIVDLRPGRYALACLTRGADGKTHAMKGMVSQLNVIYVQRIALRLPPASDVVVSVKDESFSLSKPVYSGTRTLEIDNRGSRDHHLLVNRLLPGKTLDDVRAWHRTRKGPQPFEYIGGVTRQSPGKKSYTQLLFEPGDYFLLCVLADEKQGQSRADHFLMKAFRVT